MMRPESISALMPREPNWRIDWEQIEALLPEDLLIRMASTPQDPIWHGEGNVWEHTRLVCERLTENEDFRNLSETKRTELFLAALLHDAGKTETTCLEGGRWVSPGHTKAGESLARVWLWQELGLCGTVEKLSFRECICSLIRWHSGPLHLADNPTPEQWLRRLAAQGELVPDFSLELLTMLIRADILGRICSDQQELFLALRFFTDYASELECYQKSPAFASPATRFACLQGKQVWPGQTLYDNTWGEIIMLSGLPGTGKDTWIGRHCPDMPVISLDEIRAEAGIPPVGNQSRVIQIAEDRAKKYLRMKQPFVWNATSLSQKLRQRQLDLFHNYGASVRLIYMETDWRIRQERNSNRQCCVPESTVCRYLKKIDIPEMWEAEQVMWIFL